LFFRKKAERDSKEKERYERQGKGVGNFLIPEPLSFLLFYKEKEGVSF
jgi:stalled ribosome alternative rescue factor ArfA